MISFAAVVLAAAVLAAGAASAQTAVADGRPVARGRNLAWGATVDAAAGGAQYRVDEVDVWTPQDTHARAFLETRPDEHTSVTFGFSNLLERKRARERTFYGQDRTTLEPWAWDLRRRGQGVNLSVQLKRTF